MRKNKILIPALFIGFLGIISGCEPITTSTSSPASEFHSEVILTSIQIKTNPNRIAYVIGESLDLSGGSITLNYSNNFSDDIPLSAEGVIISGFSSNIAGEKNIVVTYQNLSDSFKVMVYPTDIAGIEIASSPQVEISAGKDLVIKGGKISIRYHNKETELLDIDHSWITNIDLFNSQITLQYGEQELTTDLNFEKIIVDNTDDLINALQSSEETLILIKDGFYEFTSLTSTAIITNEKVIIGQSKENTQIKVNGNVSSQASLLFKNNVTMKNLSFEGVGTYHALKIIDISLTERTKSVYLENLIISGSKGLNIHDVNDAILKNVTILVNETKDCVALSITSSEVWIIESNITNGTWGSIGVMHKESYLVYSVLHIDDDTSLSSIVYFEFYDIISENNNKQVLYGLDSYQYIYMGTTKVYYLPSS